MTANDVKPWHRRKDETDRAFEAFRVFFELGEARSVMDAYRLYSGIEKAKIPSGGFSAWATTYEWAARARAYDLWQNEKEDVATVKAMEKAAMTTADLREDVNRRALTARDKLYEKAYAILSLPLTKQTIQREEKNKDGVVVKQEITIEPINFRLRDAVPMLALADRFGRLATGQETSRTLIQIRSQLQDIAHETGLPFEDVIADYERYSGVKIPAFDAPSAN